MSFGTVEQTKPEMSQREKDLVMHIEKMRQEMDTPFRKQMIELAAFGVREYEGVSRHKVSNLDLMNVQLSFPIVNQRLSTLFNNPSRADYRTVDEDKENYVEVLKQVSEYDKEVGRYKSDYQDLERIANIEGTAFFCVFWRERHNAEGQTVGVPSTKIRRIRMNDFYWDKAAKNVGDMHHGIEREVLSYEDFLLTYLPLEKDGFKNIRAVMPMQTQESSGNVYKEKWEELGRDQTANTITVWTMESLAFLENGKLTTKQVKVANGLLIFESKKLSTPKVNGRDLLKWSKIDGIPTGKMIGMGIPVIIRHIQEAFSRLLTASVAQAELASSPPLLTRAGADQDLDDYATFPGAVIPIRGSGKSISEDYQFLQIPDISSGAQKLMNDMIEYAIMITGVDIRALFVPASEKAITTENKRQIQEKLLRESVQWNEEHGFYDLELMRLALIQKWYPIRRTFIEEDFVGKTKIRKGFLRVPLKDFEMDEDMTGKKIKLNFKKGGYTQLKITPDIIRFNVDLIIEGLTGADERDSIKKRNFIEDMQIIFTIPAFAEKIQKAPDKPLKFMLEQMGIVEDEIFEAPIVRSNKMHPALKELSAIKLSKELNESGFKVPQDIPLPDDYEPTEFVDIFNEFIKEGNDKKLNPQSKNIFVERFRLHNDNAVNPYFQEILQKQREEKDAAAMAEAQQALAGAQPGKIPTPETPKDEKTLTASVRKEAGQLAAQSR